MMRRALLCLALLACNRTEPEPSPRPAPSSTAAPVATNGVRFVTASGDGDFAKLVRAERDRAKTEGRDLLVYVGASWCEPCQRFHEAARRGELDGAFPKLSLLEADADADRDRLREAGYASEMIPLFALPGPDGRGNARRIEGSVKGDKAVANLAPRLHQLLGN